MSVINDHLTFIGEDRLAGRTAQQTAERFGLEEKVVLFWRTTVPQRLATMTPEQALAEMNMPRTLYDLWTAPVEEHVSHPTAEAPPEQTQSSAPETPAPTTTRRRRPQSETLGTMREIYVSGIRERKALVKEAATRTGLKESTVMVLYYQHTEKITAPVEGEAQSSGLEQATGSPVQQLREAMATPAWVDVMVERYRKNANGQAQPGSIARDVLVRYRESKGGAPISQYLVPGERGLAAVQAVLDTLGLPMLLTDSATLGALALSEGSPNGKHKKGAHTDAPAQDPYLGKPMPDIIRGLFETYSYVRGTDFVNLGGRPKDEVLAALGNHNFGAERFLHDAHGIPITLTTASRVYELQDQGRDNSEIARTLTVHVKGVNDLLKKRKQYEPIIVRFLTLTRGTEFSRPYVGQAKGQNAATRI